MKTRQVHVTVDAENNADLWWRELRKLHPELARRLELAGSATILRSLLTSLSGLRGWNDPNAPAHARHPLIVKPAG